MAESEGFEPPIALRLWLISSQLHSTGLCQLSASVSRSLQTALRFIAQSGHYTKRISSEEPGNLPCGFSSNDATPSLLSCGMSLDPCRAATPVTQTSTFPFRKSIRHVV